MTTGTPTRQESAVSVGASEGNKEEEEEDDEEGKSSWSFADWLAYQEQQVGRARPQAYDPLLNMVYGVWWTQTHGIRNTVVIVTTQ
jgi:hypothetical protein